MNTERIKNVMIVLLLIIAFVFGGLILADEMQMRLSAAEEEAIIGLLAANNIIFMGDFQRIARPMQRLEMEIIDYDLSEIAHRFFGESLPELYIADNQMIFETDERAMVRFNHGGFIVLELYTGYTNEEFAAAPGGAAAEQLAREFIESIFGSPFELELFNTALNSRSDWIFNFISRYRGHIIHNNHIRVQVSESLGVVGVQYSQVEIGQFIGETQPIIAADEAMLALLNHLRGSGVQGQIMLVDKHIVYFLDFASGIGIPAYVFGVVLDNNLRFEYYFNAFTGGFLSYVITR